MSLYYDSGVLVQLYVRERSSEVVARFLARRREAVVVNSLHELEVRNALRLKRFRGEIEDEQLAASLAMIASDFATGRLIRRGVDWRPIHAEAERLSEAVSTAIGVRTIDLLHVAAALKQRASGLVSLDHRQRAAAQAVGLELVELGD